MSQSKYRYDLIQNHILKIKPSVLDVKSINNYQDFLSHKNTISNYSFSKKLFYKLVEIANRNWKNPNHFNHLNLLKNLVRYSKNHQHIIEKSELQEKKFLFLLYKNSFEKTEYINPRQKDKIRKLTFDLIQGISFGKKEEKWLCENAFFHSLVLDKVLQYPKKSETISQWVKDNFMHNELRNRRSETLSFLLDEDPEYNLNPEILREDFKILNSLDYERILIHESNLEAQELLKKEWLQIFPYEFNLPEELSWLYEDLEILPDEIEKIEYYKRPYKTPTQFSSEVNFRIPNFNLMKSEFNKNFDFHYHSTILWAIAYSRLEKKEKERLLIKNYSDSTIKVFLKICLKWKMLQPLKKIQGFYQAESQKQK